MLPLSHSLAGVVLLKGLEVIAPETFPMTSELIWYTVIFANAPDFDAWKSKTVKDHHNTPFHSPLFWLGLGGLASIFNAWLPLNIIWLIVFQALFHIFTDYITARTTGPMLFWPFKRKNYGIIGFTPEYGNFDRGSWEGWKRLIKFWMKNKVMLSIEIALSVFGIIFLIGHFC